MSLYFKFVYRTLNGQRHENNVNSGGVIHFGPLDRACLSCTRRAVFLFSMDFFLLKNRKSLFFRFWSRRFSFLALLLFFFFRKTWKNGTHANRKRRDNGSNHICIFAIVGPYFCMYNLQSLFYAVTSINVMVINWTFQRWTPRTFLFFFSFYIKCIKCIIIYKLLSLVRSVRRF